MVTMPAITSVLLIRGDGVHALISWFVSTATFTTWFAVRLGKSGTWEEKRASQPEV
jgi:hypothetical protein